MSPARPRAGRDARAGDPGSSAEPASPVAPDPRALRVTVRGHRPLVLDVIPGSGSVEQRASRADTHPVGARLDVRGPGLADLVEEGARRRIVYATLPAGGDRAAEVRRLEIVVEGWRFVVEVEAAARAELRKRARRGAIERGAQDSTALSAPIPGRVVAVLVRVGQRVEAGETLLALEAMKMENAMRAPRAGTIRRVAVVPGQPVELGDPLVELE